MPLLEDAIVSLPRFMKKQDGSAFASGPILFVCDECVEASRYLIARFTSSRTRSVTSSVTWLMA